MKLLLGMGIATFGIAAVYANQGANQATPSGPLQSEAAQNSEGDSRNLGQQVFNQRCLHCHGDGDRYPGTVSLAVKYADSEIPAALEQRQDLTPEIVALFVRRGVMTMPPFRKTEITDEELAALGAYLSDSE